MLSIFDRTKNKQNCQLRVLICSGMFLIATVMFGPIGCAGSNPIMTPGTPAADPIPMGLYPNIVVHQNLEKLLVAEPPIIKAATQLTPLAIRVLIRSVSDKSLLLQYRFVFYAPNHEQTSTNPVWRDVQIPPRTRRFIFANAISMESTDWDLEIRYR